MVAARSGLSWFMSVSLVLIGCCDAVENIAFLIVGAGYVKEGKGAISGGHSGSIEPRNATEKYRRRAFRPDYHDQYRANIHPDLWPIIEQ